MLTLGKYSIGTGDRFCRQGKAQLAAVMQARENDALDLTIVWNKSHREHVIINTSPDSVRREADEAARALAWDGAYFVDADHINLENVDGFVDASDFFTIDVADFIGKEPEAGDIEAFIDAHRHLCGALMIPGITEPLRLSTEDLQQAARKYLFAVKQAKRIYSYIETQKGPQNL